MMRYLGIDNKFIIGQRFSATKRLSSLFSSTSNDVSNVDASASAEQPNSARSNGVVGDERSKVPYIEAIREIERIESLDNPGEMVGCLSASFEKLKTAVVDHHKGKVELS